MSQGSHLPVAVTVCLLSLPQGLSRAESSALIRRVAQACLRDKSPPPAISFSYCEGWAGFASADGGRLGFDIEPSASVPERVARRVMSPSDCAIFDQVSMGEHSRIATHHWTSAEAVAKAAGEGLPMMLSRRMELRCAAEGSWGGYHFAVGETEVGLTCALALDSDGDLRGALAQVVVLSRRPPSAR